MGGSYHSFPNLLPPPCSDVYCFLIPLKHPTTPIKLNLICAIQGKISWPLYLHRVCFEKKTHIETKDWETQARNFHRISSLP